MDSTGGLDRKLTLDEYLYELNNPDNKQPSKTNVDDPLYSRKYAHTMVPLICYRLRPTGWEKVNVEQDNNRRAVFFGWNNITEYERKGIADVKQYLRNVKKLEVPETFSDRNVLKFVQANFFQIDKAGDKLALHFVWLQGLPREPKLNKYTIKLLQSGTFYIFGRDKFYRPCLVMDCRKLAELAKTDPECVTEE